MTQERIQKKLAAAGIASRRQIESWVKDGLITINGVQAKLGDKITGDEIIKIVEKKIIPNKHLATETRVLLYHKACGVICSRKAEFEEQQTVYRYLPKLKKGRWLSVGRLDLNSSGLLLFTNNGKLANKLMHPSNNIKRQYLARVSGKLTANELKQCIDGVQCHEEKINFTNIKLNISSKEGQNIWYKISMHAGKNRAIRRVFAYFDLKVSRLIRTHYANLTLKKDIPANSYRELTTKEVAKLL